MNVRGLYEKGIIKVDNAKVYGLEESILASGYPMMTETLDMNGYFGPSEGDLKRAKHLGKAKPGSGHDCYLKGITLQFDLQVPEYIWRQLDRYHFIDYISSQSKMHRILELNVDDMCNKYVTKDTIDLLNHQINMYNSFDKNQEFWETRGIKYLELRNGDTVPFCKEELFNLIIANCPCGLMLTARMTTNYLQLKSICNQREYHKMQEWRMLVQWFKGLPYSYLFTNGRH